MKLLAGASLVEVGGAVWPAPIAGDGVAGGFGAVEVVLCCGAGGWAGVETEVEGVEGIEVLGAADAGGGFGWQGS